MADRRFVLDNLNFRLTSTYPGHSVNIGTGNEYPRLVVVHSSHNIPDRDGTSGALKRFELLDETYRVPGTIVQGISEEENRKILKELLEILRPIMTVTSGKNTTELVMSNNIRSFKSLAGKEFAVEDLTTIRFYAILDPEEYSFARAPQQLKEQGRLEWEEVASVFKKLRRQQETERWSV